MIARGSYVKQSYQGRQRGRKPITAAAHLKGHVKYLAYRRMDPQREQAADRHLFSKERDQVDRHEAMRDVMEHTSSRVSFHKIVLSPGHDEPVDDWRTWTRDVMADLEAAQGKDLHWYAVHHDNTDHAHVHVVLAGAGEDHQTSQPEPVILTAQSYAQLRESGHEHSDAHWHDRITAVLREEETQDRLAHDVGARPQPEDHEILSLSHQGEIER
ncbi:MAG: hypothetical protein J2P37_25515 [Ktedonobacteraceae bacterium]|nr:hypothetical protein [Ktedonobacteraceae bacterium]